MKKRVETAPGSLPIFRYISPASALLQAWRQGYRFADLRADLLAGSVVGIVALPLSMALAIASGVPPQYGLYTAIIAGFATALLGGSRVQVSGPTAAFVIILAPISAQYGLQGLAVATLFAGLILMGMGAMRFGKFIQFIPYPVTTGFTSGIAVVIATLQIKDLLGLTLASTSPGEQSFSAKVASIVHAFPTTNWHDLSIGLFTLTVLIFFTKYVKKIPAALFALTAAAALAYFTHKAFPNFDPATIRSRYGSDANPYGIPQMPPIPCLPWNLPGPDPTATHHALSPEAIPTLIRYSFTIAMLGAIESLLSAVVSDGMSGHKHDPDAELLAQGTGNLLAPFFGGFAATGAIARTALNVRSGARSPIAAASHALFVLAAVLLLAPLLGFLPMASMAALLLLVAWNMSEAKHFFRMIRVAPKSDVAVLITCFSLTVILDMTIAVSAGVILAALLFMQRMAESTESKLIQDHPSTHQNLQLPKGLLVYRIAGPLFFGAAQKAMSQLHAIAPAGIKLVVFDMTDVPVMDATGLVNIDSTVDKLYRSGIFVVLAGVQDQPAKVLKNAGWNKPEGRISIFRSFDHGLETARTLIHLLDENPHATLSA